MKLDIITCELIAYMLHEPIKKENDFLIRISLQGMNVFKEIRFFNDDYSMLCNFTVPVKTVKQLGKTNSNDTNKFFN